jgi:hypothetical protein
MDINGHPRHRTAGRSEIARGLSLSSLEMMWSLHKHAFHRPQRAFWTPRSPFAVSELQYLLFQRITKMQYLPPP